ncbi:MAG: hypothetical protein F6J98_32125 [Moorea sp. SIO4G2]|uniref:hypothetical protein n=1 Tax=Moorena sp. SIO4A1 TaxID=2607835 RepID=UPI0013F9C822|nr:hypothetical protein [Moorena sp. SIO4A1]NEO64795.1 hypothetical protein [Moorena sp. SIO4G2]NEQ58684.1 hypothetical protein [Moorena sp. SIO4A1]
MLNKFNWNKTTTAIGLILSAVGIVVGLFASEIRCLIPIINQTCPKGHCKSLFNNNPRILTKYNRTDLEHLEFGEVEDINIIESGEDILVTGIVYLLKHPYPGNKNLEEISGTSLIYPHKFPNNPVRIQINYNKNDTWNLDWYHFSGERLEGEGTCQNAQKATGNMEYLNGSHTYNIIFERIQQ